MDCFFFVYFTLPTPRAMALEMFKTLHVHPIICFESILRVLDFFKCNYCYHNHVILTGNTNFAMNGVMYVCGFLFRVKLGFFLFKVNLFYN